MATFGWSYKTSASGSKRPSQQSRKVEDWQKNRPVESIKPLHPQSHTAETLTAGTKPRKKYDPRAKIFVGNLDFKTTEASLADYFSTFGEIENLKVIKDHETGVSRGFAFITFTDAESAVKCKQWCAYNYLKIDDRKISVSSAERRQIQHDKRKGAEEHYPTLYWEYKWTNDDSAQVYGPFETSAMLQWSKAGFFDAGCWVRQTDGIPCYEDTNEPKKARVIDPSYSDSSDSDDDDDDDVAESREDSRGNEFVHVSEIDFSMFP